MRGDGVVTRLDTLPLNHVSHVLEVAEEFGYDLQSILSGAGAGNGLDFQEGTDLPSDDYYQILEQILKMVDIPSFGVRVGQKFSLVDYGVLGYACISSPSFRHLLQTFFRFQQIVGSNDTFSETLREEGDQAMIEIRSSSAKNHLARFDIEEAIASGSVPPKIWPQVRTQCIHESISHSANPITRMICRLCWVVRYFLISHATKWYYRRSFSIIP